MPRPKRDLIRFGYKSKPEKQINLPIIYTKVPETERMIKMPVSYYNNYKKDGGLILNLDANDDIFSYPANSSIWYDTSGSRNNGTLGGSYSLVNDKAIRFGAGGDNVLSKCITSLSSGLFNQANSVFSFVICLNFSTIAVPTATKRGFTAESTNGNIAWAVQQNTSGSFTLWGQTIVSAANLATNNYYFVYSSYDNGSTNTFFNGRFIRTNYIFSMPASDNTAGNITISGRPNASASGNWTGNIAFVKLYNRVLDNIEVKDLYDKYKRQYNLPMLYI
jgi:Concanavalin A-like lectin/glucanases superfamily